jgi:two-component system, NarL family, response regulator DegU
MPIKVLIADDHELIRNALSRLPPPDPEIEVVAAAAGFAEAMGVCTELRPDVVVMDLHMGDETGVTPAQVKACFAQFCLLAISIWSDEETRTPADSFGAVALLDKAMLATMLIPAINLAPRTSAWPEAEGQLFSRRRLPGVGPN